MTDRITLTPEEAALARSRAKARADKRSRSRVDLFPHKGSWLRANQHQEGAKIAAARHFGGSLPARVHVHHAPWTGAALLVRDEQCDRTARLLVTGTLTDGYRLVGWRLGVECQDPARYRPGKRGAPAYYWPPASLRPVAALESLLDRSDASRA